MATYVIRSLFFVDVICRCPVLQLALMGLWAGVPSRAVMVSHDFFTIKRRIFE
jgi:hypothetical protein